MKSLFLKNLIERTLMKNSPGYVILGISLIILILSCKPAQPKDLIVGKWKMTDWVASPKMTNSDPGHKDQLLGATLNFTADNRFNITLAGDSVVGTYNINDDGKTVSFQPDSLSPFIDTIQELTKKSLILIDPIGNKIITTPY